MVKLLTSFCKIIYITIMCGLLIGLKPVTDQKSSETDGGAVFKKSCDAGDMSACSKLGLLEDEKGNLTEARRLYKKACDGGAMRGCSNLGSLVQEGSLAEAGLLYKKACDGADMTGCYNLALLEKQKENLILAKQLFQKACVGGEMDGCYNLVDQKLSQLYPNDKKECDRGVWMECHKLGQKIGRDYGRNGETLVLYKKSCDGGVMIACNDLGQELESNLSSDFHKYPMYFKMACDDGRLMGCAPGYSYPEIEKHYRAEARTLYQKACDGGEMKGCAHLGSMQKENGNQDEARRLYEKACDGRESQGCSAMAKLEEEKGNADKANLYYKKSCESGGLNDCYSLANLEMKKGKSAEARSFYIKSCNEGKEKRGWGCAELGVMEEKSGNIAEARKYFTFECEAGSDDPSESECDHLRALNKKDKTYSPPPDPPMTQEKFREIVKNLPSNCKSGNSRSCIELGMLLLEHSAAPGKLVMAKSAFARACEIGEKDCRYLELFNKDTTGGLLKPVLEDVPCKFKTAQVSGCIFEDCQQCPMSKILAKNAVLLKGADVKSKKLGNLAKGTKMKSIESIDIVKKFGTGWLYKDVLIGERIYKKHSKIKLSNKPRIRGTKDFGDDAGIAGRLVEEDGYNVCIGDNAQVYGGFYGEIKEDSEFIRWYKITLKDKRTGYLKVVPQLFKNQDPACGQPQK